VKEPLDVTLHAVIPTVQEPVVLHGTPCPLIMHPVAFPANVANVKWLVSPANELLRTNSPVGNRISNVCPSVSLSSNVT